MDLIAGERIIDETEVRTNLVFFWLKTRLALTSGRLVGGVPNTVALLFPVGRREVTQPLGRIANVSLDSKFHLIRALLALVLTLAGIGGLSRGVGVGAIYLTLAVLAAAYSYTAAVSISDNSGRSQDIPVSALDRKEVERFLEVVNSAVIETDGHRSQNGPVQALPAPTADRIAQLSRLSELHRDGVLSDDEFASEKRRLLDG